MPFDNPPQPRREIILLRAAKHRINHPDKWTKNCWQTHDRVCAMQAVRNICGNRRMARRLARLLARELPRRYRVFFFLPATSKVTIYNDRKSTTHEMMMELFNATIARLEFESV